MKQIQIFDTTLRDGEQSPGCSMNLAEKVLLAKQLEKLGVDIVEAGFAIASPGDFEAVQAIAGALKNTKVASLARALEKDIDAAYNAVKNAQAPRIHTFIATSDIHMRHKLKMRPDQVLEQAEAMVKYAVSKCADVEFSAEDATRSDPSFLAQLFDRVIRAGATVINIPDTVGYTIPTEYTQFLQDIRQNMTYADKATWSVHCHNDLGLAVANTLAAAGVGATQFECTVNGIGERAGNAALEELVMAMFTRKDQLNMVCNVNTQEITRTSKLLSNITGVSVQPNKAIVGANAFAHESGIHQHGVLENRSTYEIMTPDSVGLKDNRMVLGKHSGRHAFADRLISMGYTLEPKELDAAFAEFKALADLKKEVDERDLEAIIHNQKMHAPEIYRFEQFFVSRGSAISSTATVSLVRDGRPYEEAAAGDGPVDAAFRAIEKITGVSAQLDDFSLQSITEGKDAQGEAVVRIHGANHSYKGRGLSTDIVEASIMAYVDAINQMIYDETRFQEKGA